MQCYSALSIWILLILEKTVQQRRKLYLTDPRFQERSDLTKKLQSGSRPFMFSSPKDYMIHFDYEDLINGRNKRHSSWKVLIFMPHAWKRKTYFLTLLNLLRIT